MSDNWSIMTNRINRRSALKMAGATSGLLPLASGNVIGETKKKTTKLALGDTYTTPDNENISIVSGTVKQSFLYHLNPDSPRVSGREGGTYVFGEVKSSFEEKPSQTRLQDYKIFVDGKTFPITQNLDSVAHHRISSVYDEIAPEFSPQTNDMRIDQRNWGGISAEVPKSNDYQSVGVAFTGTGDGSLVVWEFDDGVLALMNSEPQFSVQRFHVKGPIAANTETEAEITVQNTGDAGIFRAVIGPVTSNHPRGLEQHIAAKTTETFTVPIHYPRVKSTLNVEEMMSGSKVELGITPAQGSPLTTSVITEV